MVKHRLKWRSAGALLTLLALSGIAQGFARKHATDDAAPAADNQVWVTRPDGAQSCSPKSGLSLEEGASELRNAHVRVLDSHKGNDGKMHMQMCGAPSGTTNAYLIPREDLPLAVAKGYITAK